MEYLGQSRCVLSPRKLPQFDDCSRAFQGALLDFGPCTRLEVLVPCNSDPSSTLLLAVYAVDGACACVDGVYVDGACAYVGGACCVRDVHDGHAPRQTSSLRKTLDVRGFSYSVVGGTFSIW